MTIIETEEVDGYTVEIRVMEGPENPREDYNHEGSLIVQLRDGYLPPSNADQADWRYDKIRAAWDRTLEHRLNGYSINHVIYDEELIKRYARAFLNAAAVEVWSNPHSDSKLVCLIDRDSDWTDPEAACKSQLAEYAAWCVGDVFGYTVTTQDGEEIDSCWGYYGNDSYAEGGHMRDAFMSAITVHRRDLAERLAKEAAAAADDEAEIVEMRLAEVGAR
jgi:hypothetical protein